VEWLDGSPKEGERRGIALAVAEPGWIHVCPGETGRADLGQTPAEVLTTIRDAGGMGLGDPVETTVDGRFALATDLDPSTSTCWRNEIHPNNDAPGLAGIAFPVGEAPAQIVAFEVNGTTVLALLWADTAAVLADWLPTAQAALDTIRFALRN